MASKMVDVEHNEALLTPLATPKPPPSGWTHVAKTAAGVCIVGLVAAACFHCAAGAGAGAPGLFRGLPFVAEGTCDVSRCMSDMPRAGRVPSPPWTPLSCLSPPFRRRGRQNT